MKGSFSFLYLLLSLVLVSCKERGSSIPDACSYLHKEDVEAVLKESFDDGKVAVVDDAEGVRTTSCTFTSARLSTPVAVFHSTGGKDPQAALKRFMKKAHKSTDIAILADLGDGAVWDGSVGQLTTFKGADIFIYSVLVTADLEEARRLSIELAKRVLARHLH